MLALVAGANLFDHRGGQKPVGGVRGQDFMTGCFDRTGLVGRNMGKLGADCRFPRTEKGGESGLIRLGAADQKMNVRVRAGKNLFDLCGGFCAVFVLAVAGGRFQVGFDQCRKDSRVSAFGIVVFQVDHDAASFHAFFFIVLSCPRNVNMARLHRGDDPEEKVRTCGIGRDVVNCS